MILAILDTPAGARDFRVDSTVPIVDITDLSDVRLQLYERTGLIGTPAAYLAILTNISISYIGSGASPTAAYLDANARLQEFTGINLTQTAPFLSISAASFTLALPTKIE